MTREQTSSGGTSQGVVGTDSKEWLAAIMAVAELRGVSVVHKRPSNGTILVAGHLFVEGSVFTCGLCGCEVSVADLVSQQVYWAEYPEHYEDVSGATYVGCTSLVGRVEVDRAEGA